MLQNEDFCTYHPQYPIQMISLNPIIFPQRKICCQCLLSCIDQNDLQENGLITFEDFYNKLEQQRNKIIKINKIQQTILKSMNEYYQQCKIILDENLLNLMKIQTEIEKLLSQGQRPLPQSEIKMFSDILIHDFDYNQKIIEDLKNNLDSAQKEILNKLNKFKEENSINIQVNIKVHEKQNQNIITIPIHYKVQEQKWRFGNADDQIYVNKKEITNLNTTFFQNNIQSNETLIIKNNKIVIFLKDKQYQIFQLKLLLSETILTIKQYVQQKEGINPSEQKIIYSGRVLQDYEKLEDLNLYQYIKLFDNEATLLLDINKTKINLFSIDEKPHFIKLNPKFTFENIIHEIQYHFDIPYKMISSILFNNTPLQQNQKIQDLVEIQTQPFELTIKLSRPIILAKTLSGKIIIINSQEFETIQNIKKEIENNYNIPISHQYIYYKNDLLDNSMSLIKIGIKQLDMININFLLDENFTQKFSIQVNNFYNKWRLIQIQPFLEVINSLSDIEIVGIPSSQASCFIKGVRVTDGKNFSDFNMKKNDIICFGLKFQAYSY
ncbi:unnamed protein product [Paramecium pentaurelia]|uniref:Ubiquitin-like domain-containing protein n=1 Tax=Paramecium pentaurelia TaxID=43138 RepID=A0A8S1WRY6_9CILI|nr:unnamed protein product [Paramecium pentaurelia]